jgi:hypothetical protein
MVTTGIRYRFGQLLLTIALATLISACGSSRKFTPADPHWKDVDNRDAGDPGEVDPSLEWQHVTRTLFDQTGQLLDIDRDVRIIAGNRREAANINSIDEVPNSAWFTNRLGLFDLTEEEIIQGVATTDGPDTAGTWTIFKPKVQGMTPGLFIEGENGDRFILKFDPKGHPEMGTGAAAMASRYFHAAGYNVPQETIVYWHPDKLRFKDGLIFTDRSGVKRPFTQQDLQDIFDRVDIQPDGRIRSLASKFLSRVRGPFEFEGVRKNDPNDWCPHEHRRELRALYVICSFINHWDIKDQNTLDILVEEDGRSYLKHYLLDFGSTFGAAGHGPQNPTSGYANQLDLRDVLVSLITLGLKKWPWEDAKPWTNPTVGYFESEIFHPSKWNPIYPIPAFEDMTTRDAYWGAKIVMAFRDHHLRALVKAGQYSDKAAEDYLFKTLVERRDKIGRHWFGKVNPLDHFDISDQPDGYRIGFEDLAVKYGVEQGTTTSYRYRVRYRGKTIIDDTDLASSTSLELSKSDLERLSSAFRPANQRDEPENHLYEIQILKKRADKKWSKPVALWLWYHPDESVFQLVGIEHLH